MDSFNEWKRNWAPLNQKVDLKEYGRFIVNGQFCLYYSTRTRGAEKRNQKFKAV